MNNRITCLHLRGTSTAMLGLLSLLLWCCTTQVYAGIYKWVDEDGKVHYSDKQPQQGATSLNIKSPGLPQPASVKPAKPIPYTGDEPARWLIYSEPKISERLVSNPQKQVAHFYFGPDCVSPTSLNWGDFEARYENALPDWQRAMQRVDDPLFKLGYRLQKSIPHRLTTQLKKTKGLLLDIEIVDIKLEICAPDLGNRLSRRKDTIKYSQNLDNFSLAAFTRSQSRMKVRWILRDSKNSAPLYQGYSEGVSDTKLRHSGRPQQALTDSLNLALQGLFSNASFVKLLKQDRLSQNTAFRQKAATAPNSATGPILSNLSDKLGNRYIKKAKFANALGIVQPLKMMVVEHYMREGRWPLNFSDIGLESHKLQEPDLVDSVDIIQHGTISVDVSSVFGQGAVFWLTPTDKDIRIQWRCTTNIDQSLVPGSCKTN